MVKMALDPKDAIPGWRVVLPNGKEVLIEGRFEARVLHPQGPVPLLVLSEQVRVGDYEIGGQRAPRFEVRVRATFAVGPGMHWTFHEDLRQPGW